MDWISPGSLNLKGGVLGFRFDTNHYNWTAILPYWFLVSLCLAISAVPWVRWKFSLRALLLVATTLIAVVLGAVVIASR